MQDTPRHVELSEKLAEHMKALVPELTAERLSKQKRIATALSRQPWLLEEYESLQSRLEAAEGENGRLKERVKDESELCAEYDIRMKKLRAKLSAAESRAQQAEEMAGRALAALELSAAPECSCQFQCQPNCPAMLYYAARKAALSTSPPPDRTDENQPTTKPQ